MSWLTPLGFLGFIGLLVLLIIYLLKPNYQSKYISSTYVWKLSLKYRKKKIPLSKLRNILLIICQILIVSSCALILAQPFVDGEDANSAKERVFIIDASGNMLAETYDETRFERAVYKTKEAAEKVLDEGGKVSVIIAGKEAGFVVQRLGADEKDSVSFKIESLASELDNRCTYGNGDIDGAMLLAEQVLSENAKAEIVLYSGTHYIDDGKVTVVDVSDETEYNVALLDMKAVNDENFYRFELTAASYGKNYSGTIIVEINGAYGTYGAEGGRESYSGEVLRLEYGVDLIAGQERKITFGNNENCDIVDLKIYSYDSVSCYVQVADALSIDNTYYLYGGSPQPLRIQYYTTASNNFTSGVLMALRGIFRQDWDIEITEIQDTWEAISSGNGKEKEIALEGYDVYVFEHHLPKELPEDGLVILLNPDSLPKNYDFKLGKQFSYNGEIGLVPEGTHPILDFIPADKATVTRFKTIESYDGDYVPLLTADGKTVAIAKNTPNSKVVAFSFSFHYSTLPIMPEFPILFKNIIDYFIPTTFENNVYELYDEVVLNSRSETLTVSGPAFDELLTFNNFPASITVDAPGTYTVTQIPISGVQVVENFSVTIPAEQSNITREVDNLTNPYYPPIVEVVDLDLVFYFAIALVALLFLEWWLKSRDN